MNHKVNTIIIGAGLTGLVTGHKLKRRGKDILILEKENRPGGVIDTEKKNGFLFEKGPNTGIVKYGEVAELFDQLKDYCQIEIPDKAVKKRYIWKKDRWEKMPSGLLGGIKTNLFTWKDKFRILGEPFRKPGDNPEETLDNFVKRRMGESFLNYAVDPFILGVYAGDPSLIVPKYALPKLYNLEQDYGSFIGGAIKKSFEKKDEMEQKATKDVFSVEGGLVNLITALYRSIGENNIVLNSGETKVKPVEEGYEVTYSKNGEEIKVYAKNLVSTVGSYALHNILPFLDKELLEKIDNLKYAKVLQAAIGFKNWAGIPLDGFGGLVPYIENRDILGALFMSSFLKNRANGNGALLSVFMGGIRREEMYYKSDQEIENYLENEIRNMFGLKEFNPDLLKIMRYEHAIPQYGSESKERFNAIEQVQDQYKGLYIAGNLKDGIGMADRIKQAWDIADTIE